MTNSSAPANGYRDRLLWILATATLTIFFQAFMVAPMIPSLADTFGTSPREMGLIVPAYLIPYGIATLIYGLLADRYGLGRVMIGSLTAFAVLTALTATAHSVDHIVLWRVVTGFGAGGVVPLALTLVGRLYPYERRGRPLGLLFGAMAGGMALGSPLGTMLTPYLGWQGLFLSVSAASVVTLLTLLPLLPFLASVVQPAPSSVRAVVAGYRDLLTTSRGVRTYAFVLINSIFHSGVFTWLGLYFEQRFSLGPTGIGFALLGYGIPGFLLGPSIGHLADRIGRGRVIPVGLAIGAIAAGSLSLDLPIVAATASVILLSLGYDMTQPMFAGLVTSLNGKRPGQAMGLNVFMLFCGFGLGSIIFGEILQLGFAAALTTFFAVELTIAALATGLFRAER